MADWAKIGTVVGSASTGSYTFILKSMQAKLGDIVATRVEVPTASDATKHVATVWGRVISIDRFNPFFPAEAAQELANQSIDLIDTVLSGSRDHLEAQVLILGTTFDADGQAELSPLTYPVKPSAAVLYPDADAVRQLLTGERTADAKKDKANPKLRIGSLIGRADVSVTLSAKQVVSRHLAILAMTGGGKTVAARRIIRELIELKYPLVIFDPHGDYLGLFEKRHLFGGSDIKIMYPVVRVWENNIGIISDLIGKMGRSLTDPQQQFFNFLINGVDVADGEQATTFIQRLMDFADNIASKKRSKDQLADELAEVRGPTINAVKRSLSFVLENLQQMERNNKRLREQPRFNAYTFHEMPDPTDAPEDIVRPGQVSIFYLAGYDHLNQSAIVSIVLEALFGHRLTLSDRIPPFQAVVEEAHNFIPSRREGIDETPSLATIRKVITEGRKFGTGLVLISQRPSRLDETTLAQCNSFLVLRIVNPNDKRFVRSVMENLSEADANILQTFGPGQGIVSGQAVRFPLLVKVDFDHELVSDAIGDEDFIAEAARWQPNSKRQTATAAVQEIAPPTKVQAPAKTGSTKTATKPGKRSRRIRPEGF
ncbi:ATP-binding protein, partial [Allosphingosinicella sp.]|uniref:ATP-binding protein n=1 Tax=Allosphingosinicella sp. TaxID=2823234 RepID=UPI003783E28C